MLESAWRNQWLNWNFGTDSSGVFAVCVPVRNWIS
jgi:hypothetical protein